MSLSRLLQTPLLQGITQKDLLQIAAKAKLSFERYSPRKKLVRQDHTSNRLLIVLSGEVEIQTESPCHRFLMSEITQRPPLIGLTSVFGLRQSYPATLIARSDVEALGIDKADLRDVLLQYHVIRLNVLTQLSRSAAASSQRLWDSFPASVPARFVRFLQHRVQMPLGQKHLKCRLVDLASELSVTRLNLSKMLHRLQERELLVMGRGYIDIPNFEKLLPLLGEIDNK